MSEDRNKAKRNVRLFWVHVALAVFVLGWFVYAVVSQ